MWRFGQRMQPLRPGEFEPPSQSPTRTENLPLLLSAASLSSCTTKHEPVRRTASCRSECHTRGPFFRSTGLYQGTTTGGCDKSSRGCFRSPHTNLPGHHLTRMLNRTRTGRRINPQYLYELRNLGQMPQRVASGSVIAAQDIDEENILPRVSAHETRLDLTQVEVLGH